MKPPQDSKLIFDGDAVIPARHINCYLMDAPDIIIESRNTAICDVPKMAYGNKPTDGGNLFLSPEERDMLLAAEPQAAPLIRQVVGSDEFINRRERYCLWLVDANPVLLSKCPLVKERIERVRQMRLASKKAATRRKADMPQLFDEVRQPLSGDLIVVPRVSSERRQYVPIGIHVVGGRCDRSDQYDPRCDAVSFRHSHLSDAQCVDAGGVRSAEERLPLFEGHRLQQLHLAGRRRFRRNRPTAAW